MPQLLDPNTFKRQNITPFAPDVDQPSIAAPPKAMAAGTVAGQAARAAGTQAGQLVRRGFQSGVNQAIGDLNTLNAGAVGAANNLTYPARAAAGFVRDFSNGLAGAPASANAGQPTAGLQTPSIATVDWNKVSAPSSAVPPVTANAGAMPAAAAPIFNPTSADLAKRGALRNPVLFNPSLDQMRAGGAIPAVPRIGDPTGGASGGAPGIDSGVTLPGGRKLSYGAMVNGVPTFSDGSGGAGIPRTMTQQDIASLGNRLNTVPSTAFTNAVDPYSGQSSDQAVASLMRSREGSKFGITPEQNAAADLAAVFNQDPRSTLGRAALNASRSANAASTTLQRKQALIGLGNLQDAVAKNAGLGIDNAGALDRVNAEGQSALKRQGVMSLADITRQALQNEGDLQRTDLAGKYDVLGRMAQGQAKTGLTEKDINDSASKIYPKLLGLDATTGKIADPSAPSGFRDPTPQELASAWHTSQEIASGNYRPSAQKPTLDQFMTAARKANPNVSDSSLKAYYLKTYGD